MSEDDVVLKAKNDALKLLSFRPRSVSELESRLKIKRYPADVIEQVIALLSKQGLLNDEKFGELYANSKIHSRPVGKKQLELDLKRKGLSDAIVQQSLEKLSDYDERAAALELVRRRYDKMTGISDQKKKARLFGFLQRRGFSSGICFSVIDELMKDV